MTSIPRVTKLLRLGVRILDRAEWSAVVNAAIQKMADKNARAHRDFDAAPSASDPSPARPAPVYLAHDAVMVPIAIVLGVEMALIEAEEALREVEALAGGDLNSARRARLQEQIRTTRETIARAIRTRGAA